MIDNNEYDAIGDFFRQKLEDHQIPVDANDWYEVERRLNSRKGKKVVWLWRFGAVAAAASVAALLYFNLPANEAIEETAVTNVLQHEVPDVLRHNVPDETTETTISSAVAAEQEIISANFGAVSANLNVTESITDEENIISVDISEISENFSVAESITDTVNQEEDKPFVAVTTESLPDVSLYIPEDDESDAKERRKWLLAAAFGVGGNSNDFSDINDTQSWGTQKSVTSNSIGNSYAVERSSNVMSFDYLSVNSFTNISHSLPFSFSVMARNSSEDKNTGMEIGLTYTYLASQFEFWNYNAHQNLHYIGIPINLFAYFGNTKSKNWSFYISGGGMVEKGMRAIYRQEANWGNVIRTTTVRSSISGLQWSLNGGLGVSCKLEKGWGLLFEPRVGYSFKNKQPISIRTEYPLYFRVNFGLYYEL